MNAQVRPAPAPPSITSLARATTIVERVLPIAIFSVALFLRLYHLDQLPTGILYDEAYNGIDVTRIINGARPIFLADNFGRESLFIYLQALSSNFLGQTAFSLRIVATVFGSLTVLFSFVLVRRLFNARVALLACAWLSISLWHVIISRIGLRTISLPLFIAIAFYCLWVGLDLCDNEREQPDSWQSRMAGPGAIVWFSLSGLSLGLSLYTYTAGRFAPLVILVLAAYLAIFRRETIRKALPGFAVLVLTAIVAFAPPGTLLHSTSRDLR